MLVKTVDIRQITDAEYAETEKFFMDTAEKVKNFLPEDRKRTLAGRYLLKKMIKEIYGREGFELSYNENGKPELDFCFFSISHSGNYAVCAVAQTPVGIDIENTGRFKRREKYMFFTDNETRYVNSRDSARRFCIIWTRKEAYIKALGEPLAFAAKTDMVTPELSLKDSYGGYAFDTRDFGEYVITTAQKEP